MSACCPYLSCTAIAYPALLVLCLTIVDGQVLVMLQGFCMVFVLFLCCALLHMTSSSSTLSTGSR